MISINVILLLILTVSAQDVDVMDNDNKCCCCEISNFWQINREWINKEQCIEQSNKVCCKIPTKYECELKLNPTFDTTCGHLNERQYQIINNGPKPQSIPRHGYYEDKFVVYGWLHSRLMDKNGNEIQEWCIDNGPFGDSFFLWRFIDCKNAYYPHWFARCAYPIAVNMLLYKSCDNVMNNNNNANDFSLAIPDCFGEIQEVNIGFGTDYGRDLDYRYNVQNEQLWIWCTLFNAPKNPPIDRDSKDYSMLLYNEKAPGFNQGFVPFYLSQCRKFKPNVLIRNSYSDVSDITSTKNEMSSIAFKMNIVLNDNYDESNMDNNIAIPNSLIDDFAADYNDKYDKQRNNNNNRHILNFALKGNNKLPDFYASSINYLDNWSLGLDHYYYNKITDIILPNNDWFYNLKKIENDNNNNNNHNQNNNKMNVKTSFAYFITFIYNSNDTILLTKDTTIQNFQIVLDDNIIVNCSNLIGWIAHSHHNKGDFNGFGTIKLC